MPARYTGAAGGDHEGLYDEPAFTAANQATLQNKSNPVYMSTENLAAADDAEASGYLGKEYNYLWASDDFGVLTNCHFSSFLSFFPPFSDVAPDAEGDE